MKQMVAVNVLETTKKDLAFHLDHFNGLSTEFKYLKTKTYFKITPIDTILSEYKAFLIKKGITTLAVERDVPETRPKRLICNDVAYQFYPVFDWFRYRTMCTKIIIVIVSLTVAYFTGVFFPVL